VVVPIILNYVGLSNFADLLVRTARWPAMLVGVALALALIYRFGPDREPLRWRWITWGSAVATILWLAVSALFSWCAANFGKFNETYGKARADDIGGQRPGHWTVGYSMREGSTKPMPTLISKPSVRFIWSRFRGDGLHCRITLKEIDVRACLAASVKSISTNCNSLSGLVLVCTDSIQLITVWIPAAPEIFGYGSEETVGRPG
jgi:hypothetical protein